MWSSCYRKRSRKRISKFICFILGSIFILYLFFARSDTSETESLQEIHENRQPSADFVLPNENTVLYNPKNKCQNQETEPVLAVFIVVSAPANRNARNVFRTGLKKYLNDINYETENRKPEAASPKPKLNELLFFSGKPKTTNELAELFREAKQYNDLIIDNLEESYVNLTLKSLRILKWAELNCGEAEFMIKIDDDFHLNLKKFLDTLYILPSNEARNLIGGDVRRGIVPVRDPNSFFGKFHVPMSAWPLATFPDFVSGAFYVLGRDARKKIYAEALRQPLFPLEDVFITGIIGKYSLGMDLTNLKTTANYWTPIILDLVTSSCDIQDKYIGVHFHSKWYNSLDCWKTFNDKDFVCTNWPLVTHCWFG